MIPTKEMVEELLTDSPLSAHDTNSDSWDCRFATGNRVRESDKFWAMYDLVHDLMKKGVDRSLLQVRLSFPDKNDEKRRISYPRVYVNTKLSEQQQEQQRVAQTADAVEALRNENEQLKAMMTAIAARLGVSNPVVETPTEATEGQPF